MLDLPRGIIGEATRLTKAGRLAEAVAALRGTDERRAATPEPNGPVGLVSPTHPGTPWGGTDATRVQPAHPIREALTKLTAPIGPSMLERLGNLKAGPGFGRQLGALKRTTQAPIPEGATFEDRSFSAAAGTRGYKLYVPSRYTGQPVPLVIMLHGCTQSPDDFAAGTRMNELAEERVFLVAYPAQTQAANSSRCWNWFNVADQRRDRGEPALIAGITTAIIGEFEVDPDRVYVAGLSAGGATAAIMGAAYPDLYAAVGVHSGLACGAAKDMPSAFAAMRQGNAATELPHRQRGVPTIVFHGDGDQTVHPVNGDQVIAQSKADGLFVQTVSRGRSDGGQAYTRTIQSDGSGHPVLEQWVLHDAGHAWSGGSPAGSYTDPRGPDAARAMINFFWQQRRG